MQIQSRFGRKIKATATVEIKHDLGWLAAADVLNAVSRKNVKTGARSSAQTAEPVTDLSGEDGQSGGQAVRMVARYNVGELSFVGAGRIS